MHVIFVLAHQLWTRTDSSFMIMACGSTSREPIVLIANFPDHIREILQKENINDELLLLLSDEDIAQMFTSIGDKVAVKAAIERSRSKTAVS